MRVPKKARSMHAVFAVMHLSLVHAPGSRVPASHISNLKQALPRRIFRIVIASPRRIQHRGIRGNLECLVRWCSGVAHTHYTPRHADQLGTLASRSRST
jgi:hypothetical protein